MPTAQLELRAPDLIAAELAQVFEPHALLAFTSRYGVRALRQALPHMSASLQANVRESPLGAVGRATADEVRELSHRPSIVGATSTGVALAEVIVARVERPPCVVHLCGAHARPEFADSLARAGIDVRAVVSYANRAPSPPSAERLQSAASADVIYLAAPSAADRLLTWHPPLMDKHMVCIGPTTAGHLHDKHGVTARAVASSPRLADVLQAIESAMMERQ